jgi:hypothetical protein
MIMVAAVFGNRRAAGRRSPCAGAGKRTLHEHLPCAMLCENNNEQARGRIDGSG